MNPITRLVLQTAVGITILCGGMAVAASQVAPPAQTITMEHWDPRDNTGSILIADIQRQITANLTQGVQFAAQPAWSLDGRRLAFSADFECRLCSNAVFVMEYGTLKSRLLLSHVAPDHLFLDLAWSPDVTQLALLSVLDGDTGVFVVNTDTGDFYRVSDRRLRYEQWPTWSPDGQQIAFVTSAIDDYNWNLYVVNADGTNARVLSMSSSWDSPPSWSPDGRQLVIAGYGNGVQVVSVAPDGLTSHRISDGFTPVWSPVNDQIAFVMQEIANNGDLSAALYTIMADGNDLTRLYGDEDSWIYQVRWSADGSRLAFSVECGVERQCIYVIAPDGSALQHVTDVMRWYDEDGAFGWQP